jgi:hypothetical protein
LLALAACRRAPFDPNLDDLPDQDGDSVHQAMPDAGSTQQVEHDAGNRPPHENPEHEGDAAEPNEQHDAHVPARHPDASVTCGDTDRDLHNCGTCGHVCPGAGLDEASCSWGECKLQGCTFGDYEGHTYAFCTTPKTWLLARSYCQSLSLDLLDIGSIEERAFVESLVGASLVWFGLNDRTTEGDYYFVAPGGKEDGRKVWSQGHAVDDAYVPWATTQPDSFGDEDCGRFDPGKVGGYQDVNCELIWGFVCESY